MRKKRSYKKHEILPDPIFLEVEVSKFINKLMKKGKKLTAYKIFYDTIKAVGEKTKENGLEVWKKAIENVSPTVETKRRRIGGGTTQIPIEIGHKRSSFLGMKWLIEFARERREKTMVDKLTNEIIAAYNNEGKTIKKKEDMHKMAASNKVYASFKIN